MEDSQAVDRARGGKFDHAREGAGERACAARRRAPAPAPVKRPRLRRRKAPAVDRALFPHDYTGPRNSYGLAPGPCVIERPWAGGVLIRFENGQRFTVSRRHVKRAPK